MFIFAILLNIFFSRQPSIEIIDGYTNRISAFPGDSIDLYLNSRNYYSKHNTKLFDLDGKEVANYTFAVFPQSSTNERPYEKGYDYRITKRIIVPPLKSGVYLWENKIPFVIKNPNPKIVILYTSNTINAYCNAGGKSMYGYNSTDNIATSKASFLRPLPLPKHSEAFLRWINKQQFSDIGYITDLDLEDYNSIKKSRLIIIPGHSEYWTLQARRNFDRFVSEGKNALVLSGNTMWWQVRYNKTKDQLICYRSIKDDPIKSTRLKTTYWNDKSLNYPITSSTGTDFSLAGYGLKNDKGWDGYKIISKSPLLENTSLKPGDVLPCPSDELDGAPLVGFVNQKPVLNYEALGFERAEIIGYDQALRGVATWIVFKATRSSGIVINTASTDWCSFRGIGSSEDIQKITYTMITKLLNNENVFSTPEDLTTIVN